MGVNTSAPQPEPTDAGGVPSGITEGVAVSTLVTDDAAINHFQQMFSQVTEEATGTERTEETETTEEAENTRKTK